MTTTCLIYDSFMTIDDFRLAIEKNSSLKKQN
ncbi:Transposase [Providencia stuartii]|nr:Transposase [Providencia stuartii]CAK6602726.1 Transposase [Providencia stuartii]